MTEEKQPMKTDKPMGILALILAIILAIVFLSSFKDVIKNFVFVIQTFAGKTESSFPGKAIGSLFASGLIFYFIIKLFKYSGKTLSSEKQDNTPETPGEQKVHELKVYNINSGLTTKHLFIIERSLDLKNGNVIWNTKFDFNGELLESQNQHFLSQTINNIRKVIEPMGFRILVKCSDLDAAHSGMQADMSAGTQIYKLNDQKQEGKSNSYDVLQESDTNSVAALEEQIKFREEFYKTAY